MARFRGQTLATTIFFSTTWERTHYSWRLLATTWETTQHRASTSSPQHCSSDTGWGRARRYACSRVLEIFCVSLHSDRDVDAATATATVFAVAAAAVSAGWTVLRPPHPLFGGSGLQEDDHGTDARPDRKKCLSVAYFVPCRSAGRQAGLEEAAHTSLRRLISFHCDTSY